MSGGYNKEDVIRNLRNKRVTTIDELKSIANGVGVHKYAQVEAKRELRRRANPSKKKVVRRSQSYNPFGSFRMPKF